MYGEISPVSEGIYTTCFAIAGVSFVSWLLSIITMFTMAAFVSSAPHWWAIWFFISAASMFGFGVLGGIVNIFENA